MRGALQGRRNRLPLFAAFQSQRLDVRAPHDPAGTRRRRAIAELAHQGGGRLIVDNVFARPIWQSPLQLGADVVVYSATKHIDGQGRCLGGIILSSEQFIADHIHTFLRQTGPSMSPFNAWVLLKGLETLAIRVRAQTETAAAVADALASHPKISGLVYSGRADHPQAALVKKQMP